MAEKLNTKVKTGEVRLSYTHLFEPFAFQEDQKAKYSATLIIPKSDTKTLNDLKTAYDNAFENTINEKGNSFAKAKTTAPFVRVAGGNYGLLIDPENDPELSNRPEYKDCYLMNVKTDTAPGVLAIERGKGRLTKENGGEDVVYSGCYAKVTLNVYPFFKPVAGISAGLNNVLKTRDGERFGGAAPAESDFADELAEIEASLADLI